MSLLILAIRKLFMIKKQKIASEYLQAFQRDKFRGWGANL